MLAVLIAAFRSFLGLSPDGALKRSERLNEKFADLTDRINEAIETRATIMARFEHDIDRLIDVRDGGY